VASLRNDRTGWPRGERFVELSEDQPSPLARLGDPRLIELRGILQMYSRDLQRDRGVALEGVAQVRSVSASLNWGRREHRMKHRIVRSQFRESLLRRFANAATAARLSTAGRSRSNAWSSRCRPSESAWAKVSLIKRFVATSEVSGWTAIRRA
jgi:hypothetical protein